MRAVAENMEAFEKEERRCDRDAFLTRHANITGELRQFLEDDSVLKRNAP